MTRPIWAMIANHYTRRRNLDASYLTRIAARSAPEGGGGDYGPNSGGYDQLGFGTLAFTRDRAKDPTAAPAPAPGASASTSASTSGGSDARPQTGGAASPAPSASTAAGGDLAATGSTDVVAWTAATGITALAGGLLLLRRRGRAQRGSQ
jgi:LPXTG-motif cell wall-anchored protein